MTMIAAPEAPTAPVPRHAHRSALIVGGVFCSLLIVVLGGLYVWRWQMAPPETTLAIAWPSEMPEVPAAPKVAPSAKKGRSLSRAPDPRLVDAQPAGLLPKIAEDGSRPLDVYARPALPVSGPLAEAPRIAILIKGAGIGQLATVEAMVKLPPDISIALSPYSSDLDRQADDLRSEGHEILLDLPIHDPETLVGSTGPQAIADSLSPDVNQQRLFWAMSRFSGFVGVSGHFTQYLSPKDPSNGVVAEIKKRGLGLLDYDRREQAVVLDSDLRPPSINEALRQLEQKAKLNGVAIGVAGTTPLAIDQLKNWSAGLASRGFRLVPVSALLQGDP